MAPTLFSPRHDETQQISLAVKVPDVFVVPPEEDQSPTWCYFNAADAPLRSSDSDSPLLDNPLTGVQARSHSLYDSAGPFGSHNATILSVLDQPSTFDVRHCGDNATEIEYHSGPYPRNASNEGNTSVGNDSDVVEVVKVRRQAQDEQKDIRPASPPRIKRSKSFKTRASKVFRSIKIVGKVTNRSKHHVSDIPPLPPMPKKEQTARNNTEEDLPPRSKTPTVSRRRSTILSQLFSHSTSSVDVSHNTPEIPEQSTFPLPVSTSPFSPNMVPRPPSPSPDLLGPSPSGSSDPEVEYRGIRSASPSPSMRTFSGKRRFSVLGLQRLFSFSNDTESTDSYPLNISRNFSGPSTASSSEPDTPTEERTPSPPLPYQLQLDLPGAGKPLDILPSISTPSVEPGDISYEMRLDSLHFDALSFDVDRF